MKRTLNSHKYSAIIPTLNAEQDLLQLLSALKNQTLADQLEIIVIDSGSTDDTVKTAEQFGARVIQIKQNEFNHGRTRNLAASKSRGDFLFFFTQDAKPLQDDFCERMISSMLAENAAGGFARQIARPSASPIVQRDIKNWIAGSEIRRVVRFDSMTNFCRLEPMKQYLSCIFDNVSSVIRRDVWEKIPIPDAPYGEDIEWGMRTISNGYAIVYEPNAMVEHSHDRPPAYTYKRTLIDHYRLYELFGVRTTPTRTAALKGWSNKTLRDWAWLLRHPALNRSWARDMMQAPRHAWASNWGQYEGARRAAQGLAPVKQQGV
ncbi:MAG: glycosyltransferase [Candidatus Hinthialibacter antarcticus]|nr:glycosyltransferase [Candidatus Hinthialibacter antarcticus]